MKYIFQGIKDYCQDCLHDWHLHHIEKSIGNEPVFYLWDEDDMFIGITDWKEGSVWYYIKQRKIANQLKREIR